MGTRPWLSLFTLSSSLSTHKTRWPISAKHAAATKPTYPDPTTVIAIDSLILFSGLRLGMRCLDVTTYLGGKPYSNRARWIRRSTCGRSKCRVMGQFWDPGRYRWEGFRSIEHVNRRGIPGTDSSFIQRVKRPSTAPVENPALNSGPYAVSVLGGGTGGP